MYQWNYACTSYDPIRRIIKVLCNGKEFTFDIKVDRHENITAEHIRSARLASNSQGTQSVIGLLGKILYYLYYL